MISHKAPAIRIDFQNEKYVTAILNILDEEINLQVPSREAEDPSDELDLLVADLLKYLSEDPRLQ